TYQDSFQYSTALGLFHLGRYDEAINLAEKIAASTYKDASGAERESPNRWQALYILGQIHDARHQPAQAVAYYQRVTDRFTDAASAVKSITRKQLSLPEVAVVRPKSRDQVAAGLRAVGLAPPADDENKPDDADMTLTYRNLPEVDIKVYPVDLMRLYLTRRSLSDIADIDLAGIHPLIEKTVKLDGELSYDEKTQQLDLAIEKEGAYLVMARGENLYASGIVLVSPLELEVLEEPDAGRVRVRVIDTTTHGFVPKAQVKVLGSDNPTFLSGETDLRGVYVAEGVLGIASAVARLDTTRYAFYRGDQYLGQPPIPAGAQAAPAPSEAGKPMQQSLETESLDKNLRDQNLSNQMRQLERLQNSYNAPNSDGVQVDKAR
ncbi:MAG TPA: tetratricopeptide repeat protein, partial [Isosphaeraceae bacterium]|nr:tetratricopeptide repeat protein [Isosphaeraceae bacterium]